MAGKIEFDFRIKKLTFREIGQNANATLEIVRIFTISGHCLPILTNHTEIAYT